jgi:DNA-binding NarL/FixJ family response regulator
MTEARLHPAGRPRNAAPRVLIADDEPETQVLVRSLLEEEGIDVVGTATGGLQAVSLAKELHPDVVLMDVRMPDLDGVRAMRRVKSAHPHTQVIFFTIYDDPDPLESTDELGAFCYLVKGCPPSMIVEMIRRAWQHGKAMERRSSSVIG